MDELGFQYTWTPAYSPAYNGVEEVINIGKQMIKKKRLDHILRNEEQNLNEIILTSFKSICTQQIAKCVRRSLTLVNFNN